MSLTNPNKVVTEERLSDFYQGILPYLGSSGTEYTAGDGINIDENDEISTDNMPSEDMSEVASPMPSVMSRRFKYSTEEQIVGEWIDGKPVYQKTVTFSTVSGTHAHGIANLDLVVDFMGIVYRSSDGQHFSLDKSKTENWNNQLITGVNRTEISISVGQETFSEYSGFCTIQYTKTTD